MQRYSSEEIRFNLMAIVTDRKMLYLQEIEALNMKKQQLLERIHELRESSKPEGGEAMETDQANQSVSDLEGIVQSMGSEILRLQSLVSAEDDKMLRYKVENIRRKHNYIPLIMEMLKLLAKKGELVPLVEKAKEEQKAKKAQKTK
ncbi:predicted protein [Nematostella vectensis]|uniref:UCH37-like C-terminal domain-containing protein n=3 Tax=Nematostella vectensis TaxID=45351 RepID=A7SEQ2_NEMVE|nr:predicted protein [Nematostella vectensis]|eukprot:XP_001629893.1 predicted protein [Nematostella vectensis]